MLLWVLPGSSHPVGAATATRGSSLPARLDGASGAFSGHWVSISQLPNATRTNCCAHAVICLGLRKKCRQPLTNRFLRIRCRGLESPSGLNALGWIRGSVGSYWSTAAASLVDRGRHHRKDCGLRLETQQVQNQTVSRLLKWKQSFYLLLNSQLCKIMCQTAKKCIQKCKIMLCLLKTPSDLIIIP